MILLFQFDIIDDLTGFFVAQRDNCACRACHAHEHLKDVTPIVGILNCVHQFEGECLFPRVRVQSFQPYLPKSCAAHRSPKGKPTY